MEQSLRQQYVNYYMISQNLMIEISKNSSLLENQEVQQKILQLQECFNLPIREESLRFFERRITSLKQYIAAIKSVEENHIVEEEGRQSGYTKVRKSGNAFIPVEEDSEKKDIEVPNYVVPVPSTYNSSLRDYPDYVLNNKNVTFFPVTNSNRGSSHVFMLAFLTFLFESIFLVLAFFLYQ